MYVLVDYDNLERSDRDKGLHFIADQIASQIESVHLQNDKRLIIRLYGGWYQEKSITTKAQQLQSEINDNFPNTTLLCDNKPIIVRCELAFSTLAEPAFHLFHTFREKSITSRLYPRKSDDFECKCDDCPVTIIHNFLKKGKCPKCETIKLADVIYKREQKLVDSMIVTDLIFQSKISNSICLVSSDDDCWPGIRATILSCTLIHIRSKSSYHKTLYTNNINENYIHKTFNYE